MENLRQFLSVKRVLDKSPYNLLSLRGGKWYILPCERAEFFRLYKAAARTFTKTQHRAFVFVPPKGELQPLCIDVDIKTKSEIGQHTDLHHQLAVRIAGLLEKEGPIEYLVVQKPAGYWKTLKNKDENVYCTGCHLLFPGTNVSPSCAEKNRLASCKHVSEIFGHFDMANSVDSVLDKRVTNRVNGLMFLYDYKGEGFGGQYQVKIAGKYQEEAHTFDQYTGDQYLEKLDMERIYGFAFDTERLPDQETVRENQEKKPVPQKTSGGKVDLDLELYMEALGGWVPPQDQYVKLVMFFANTNLNPEYVADICNRHWAPPGHQTSETIHMLYKYKGCSSVSRGTAQWILQQHAKKKYNLKQIFPAKVYKHYNEYIQFVGKLNRRQDIEDFLKQVVGYVFKVKQYVWASYTTVRDKHGKDIKNVVTNLSKFPPFTKSDDLRLKCFPKRAKLIEALDEKVSVRTKEKTEIELYSKIHEVLNTADKMPIEDLFEKTKMLLGHKCPGADYIKMSKLLANLHLSHELARYADIVFKPFAGKNDYTDPMVLNTFSGFPFEWYTPTVKIDVKETQIWKFLVDVYGMGEEGPLLAHVLNMIAHLVQKPHIRSERITAIISPGEGTGKSSFFHILQMILSPMYCKFHASLTPYLDRFNITNLGKLIHWCDDISASSGQKETRLLFSRVTSHTQKYEQKGETCVVINEFSNLFITANEEAPLMTHPGDRRQQILEAADTHIQDRKFFGKVYEEIDSLDVGYAFYTFFKQRDLGEWEPSCNPPSKAKDRTIAACIKKSHTFLNEAFVNSEWLRTNMPAGICWGTFLKKVEVHIMERGGNDWNKGELRIRIEKNLFYGLYKTFMREHYPASKQRNQDTFFKETALLGVGTSDKRQSVNKRSNYFVVDIFYKKFKRFWEKEYPSIPVHEWDSEKEQKKFIKDIEGYQENQNRFVDDD